MFDTFGESRYHQSLMTPERGTACPYDFQIPIPIKLWPAQQQKPSGTDTGSQGGTKAQCQDAVAQEAEKCDRRHNATTSFKRTESSRHKVN